MDTLTLILILISSVLTMIKYNFDWMLLFKRHFLDVYCIISNNSGAEVFKNLHLELKSKNYKSAEVYLSLQPFHMVVDNELIKSILQTDFLHFTHRGMFFNKKYGIIDENILNAFHDEWRSTRTKLTPSFTPSKLKKNVELIKVCAKQMTDAFNSKLEIKKNVNVDIGAFTVKYFANISSAFVLGLESDSFQNEQNAKFEKYASKLFTDKSLWRNCKLFLAQLFPNLGTNLGILFAPKKTADFFVNLVDQVANYRQQNNVVNDDMLKLMLDLKSKGAMTMEDVTAQCLIFYIANFETSSLAFTFCLYELAKNQTIQEQLRDEINTTYELNEEITYESLKNMKYLERVISESLRKYPPVHVSTRKCTNDYKIPNSDKVIKKGTTILISYFGLHHDPEYYPNPEEFDPDRFIPEIAETRPQFSFLPFGGGPRNCIGGQLAVIEIKLGLISLLRNFKFSLNEDTIAPVTFQRFLIFLTAQHKIMLNVEKV